jgi:hypothetical protein
MATITTIPITVAPEAAARVTALGMQREFEAMLAHTRQRVSGLRAIEVTLDVGPDAIDDPAVIIFAHRDDPGPGDDPTDRVWGEWQTQAFPPEVWQHFTLLSCDHADGR